MAWGKAREGRLDWAVGGFNGHLTGLADNNPNQEAVGYLNFRPFLRSDRFPALRHLNVGASGSLGEFARNEDPLPMRTSVQAAENDEAANDASAVFLDFNEGAVYQGEPPLRRGPPGLLPPRPLLRVGVELRPVPDDPARPARTSPRSPCRASTPPLAYFLTGEQVERRTTVVPLRPFRPFAASGAPAPSSRSSATASSTSGTSSSRTGSPTAASGPTTWGWSTSASTGIPTAGSSSTSTWQHAAFGSPVLVNEAKGVFGRSTDLFWVRCQVYF